MAVLSSKSNDYVVQGWATFFREMGYMNHSYQASCITKIKKKTENNFYFRCAIQKVRRPQVAHG